MGGRSGIRATAVISIIVVVLVSLIIGGHVARQVTVRNDTADVFAAMGSVDKRIDLPRAIPDMKRSQWGIADHPWNPADDPTIMYSVDPTKTPDWLVRLHAAMGHAGYGSINDYDSWQMPSRGYEVSVDTTPPDGQDRLAYISITTWCQLSENGCSA